jgi:hypothetical protein
MEAAQQDHQSDYPRLKLLALLQFLVLDSEAGSNDAAYVCWQNTLARREGMGPVSALL